MDNEPVQQPQQTPRRLAPVRAAALAAAVLLGAFMMLLGSQASDSQTRAGSRLVGELAPLIQADALDGSTFDIDRQRGRWVLVNFFSTTCVPCVVEHPELVALDEHDELSRALTVVSIAFDDSEQNLVDFFNTHGGDWPVVLEDAGSYAVSYGVTGVPETILVAPTGVIADRFIGGITETQVLNRIDMLTTESG